MKKLTTILLAGLIAPCLLAVEAYKGGALYDTAPPGGGDFVERKGDSMYGTLDMDGNDIVKVDWLQVQGSVQLPNNSLINQYFDIGSVDSRVILDGTIHDDDIGEVTLGGLFDVQDYNPAFWGPVNGDTIIWNAGAQEWRYATMPTPPTFLPPGNWKDMLTKDNSGNPYSYEAIPREEISIFDWGDVASDVLGDGFLLFWNENVAPNQQNFVPKYIGDVVAWNMLSDTAPMGTAGTGQIPVFGSDDKWYPQDPPPSVAGDPQPMTWLTDTPPATSTSPKTLLAYEPGDQWRYRALNYWGIDELGDVFAPTPQVDQVLTWNGNQWVALPAQTGTLSVFELTDVTEKTWNTSEINFLIAPAGTEEFENAAMSLGMAYDVDYTGLNADKILKFSTTSFKWEVADDNDTIYDLDVDQPGTNTGDILVWQGVGLGWGSFPIPPPDLSDVWLYGTNDTLPNWIRAHDYGLKASTSLADRSQYGFTSGLEPDIRGVNSAAYIRGNGLEWLISPNHTTPGYVGMYASTTSPPPTNQGRMYTRVVDGETEMFWYSDDFNDVQVTRDGSVNSINKINTRVANNLGEFLISAGTNITIDGGPRPQEITINAATQPVPPLALDDLTDVDALTGVVAGSVIKYNATSSQWEIGVDNDSPGTGSSTLPALDDVTISSPAEGQYLRVNQPTAGNPDDWVNSAILVGDLPDHAAEHEPGGGDILDFSLWDVGDLGDVNGGATNGQFLMWVTNTWAPTTPKLNLMDDVNHAEPPATGEALVWNGTAWVNSIPGGTLEALTDVTLSGAKPTGFSKVLLYDPTATDGATPPQPGAWVDSTLTLTNMADVVDAWALTGPDDGDVLYYTDIDPGAPVDMKWVNTPFDDLISAGAYVRLAGNDIKTGTLEMGGSGVATRSWLDFSGDDVGISFGSAQHVQIGPDLNGLSGTFQLFNDNNENLLLKEFGEVWVDMTATQPFYIGNYPTKTGETVMLTAEPRLEMKDGADWTNGGRTMSLYPDANGMILASDAPGPTYPKFEFVNWESVVLDGRMEIKADSIENGSGAGADLTFANWDNVNFDASTIDWTSVDKTGSKLSDLDDVNDYAGVPVESMLMWDGTDWGAHSLTVVGAALDPRWVNTTGDVMTGDLLLTSNADLQLERGSSVIRFDSPVAAVDPVIYLNTNDNLIFDMNDGGTTWFYDSSQLSIYQTDSTSNHVQFNVSSLAESWYEGATLKYQQNVDSTATRLLGFDTNTTLEVGGTFVNVTLPNNAVNANEIANDVPISKLSDVDTTGASADDWLQYDGTTWRPQAFVSEVIPPGSSTSHILRWNGASWVATPFSTFLIADLGDVSSTTPATGQVLKWDGVLGVWVPAEDNASTVNTIGDLGDVTVTAPQQRDLLSWRGTEWVNVPPADYLLSEWSEVQYNTGTMVASDSVLVWNGTTFVDSLLSTLVPPLVSGAYVEVAGDNMTGNLVMVSNAEVRVEGGGALRLEDDAPLLLQTDTSFPHLYFDSTQDRTELHQMSKSLQVLDSGPVFMDTNIFTLSDVNGSFQVQTATSLFQLSDAIRVVTHDLTAASYAIFPGSALPLDLSGFSDLYLPAGSVNAGELATNIPIDTWSDVDTVTAAPTNDQVLTWDGANWVPADQQGGWTPPAGTVNDEIMVWSSGAGDWVAASFFNRYPLRSMNDVSATTPATDDVLTWTGTEWAPQATGATVQNLDDLLDVDTTSVTNKDFLSYNGAYWEPIDMASYGVGEMGDVDTSGVAVAGDSFLLWDGTNYAQSSLALAIPPVVDARYVRVDGDTMNGNLLMSTAEIRLDSGSQLVLEDDAPLMFSGASTTPYQYYNNSQSRLYTQLEQKPWYIMDAQSVFIEDASTFRVYDTARSNIEFSTTFATFVMQNYLTTGDVTHDLDASRYTISTATTPMDLVFTGWDNVDFSSMTGDFLLPADTIDHASLKDYLLEDISDVNITGRVDGSVLVWDAVQTEWEVATTSVAPGVNWYDWPTGTGSNVGVVYESDGRVWNGTAWEARPLETRDLHDLFYYRTGEPGSSATLEVDDGDVLAWTYNSELLRYCWNPIAVTGNLPVLPISSHGAMLFWDGALNAWSDTAREAGLFRIELMHWDMATNFGTDVIYAPPMSAGLPSNEPGNVVFGMGWTGGDPNPTTLQGAVEILQGTPLNFVETTGNPDDFSIAFDTHANWSRLGVQRQHTLAALTGLQLEGYYTGGGRGQGQDWTQYGADLSFLFEMGLPSSTQWVYRDATAGGTPPDDGWNIVQGALHLDYNDTDDTWDWTTLDQDGTVGTEMDFSGLTKLLARSMDLSDGQPATNGRQYQLSFGNLTNFDYKHFLMTRHDLTTEANNWVLWDLWQPGDAQDKAQPDAGAWTFGVRGDARLYVNPDNWNDDDASRDATLNATANNELTTKWYVDNNTSVGAHGYGFETVTADTTSPRMDVSTNGNTGCTMEITIRGGANNRDFTYVKFVTQYYVESSTGYWRSNIIASHRQGDAFSNNLQCSFNAGAYAISMNMLRDDATTVKVVGYRTDAQGGGLTLSRLGTPNDGTGNLYGSINF